MGDEHQLPGRQENRSFDCTVGLKEVVFGATYGKGKDRRGWKENRVFLPGHFLHKDSLYVHFLLPCPRTRQRKRRRANTRCPFPQLQLAAAGRGDDWYKSWVNWAPCYTQGNLGRASVLSHGLFPCKASSELYFNYEKICVRREIWSSLVQVSA